MADARHERQLGWERRTGRIAAAAALGAIGLVLARGFYEAGLVPGEQTAADRLLAVDRMPTDFLAGACVQALSNALIAVPLVYLVRAARYRRPALPRWLVPLALFAPVLLGAVIVASQIAEAAAAHEFARAGARTPERARELVREQAPVVNGFGIAATLLFAGTFAAVSLTALRTGLVSRFLGVLGFFVAVSLLLPGGGLLLFVWLAAIALVLADRWPGGRGAAWRTGEDDAWLTLSQQAEATREAEAAEGEGAGSPRHAEDSAAGVTAPSEDTAGDEQRPASADADHPPGRSAASPRRRRRRRG